MAAQRSVTVDVKITANAQGLNSAVAQAGVNLRGFQQQLSAVGSRGLTMSVRVPSPGTLFRQAAQGLANAQAGAAFAATPVGQGLMRAQAAAAAARGLAQQQAQVTYLQSPIGQAQGVQQQLLAGQRSIAQQQAKLAYMQSPQGLAQAAAQQSITQQMARQQDWMRRVAREGVFGAHLGLAAERFAPLARLGTVGAAAGAGLIGMGVHSLPATSEQLSNSFDVLRREIGIGLIPDVARLSGWLQNAARGVRSLNEASGGRAGSALFWGTAALGGLGLAGAGLNMARNAVGGLHWAAQAAGVVGPAAGGAAGQAGGGMAGRAAAGAGSAGLGGLAVTAGGYGLVGLSIAGIVGGIGDVVYTGYREATEGAPPAPGPGASEEARRLHRFIHGTGGLDVSANYIPFASTILNFRAAQLSAGLPADQGVQATGLGGWLGRQVFGEPLGGAGGAGLAPQLMINRQGQLADSVESLYDRIVMQTQNMTPQQAEQEAREYQTLIAALQNLSSQINQSFPPQGG